MCFLTCALPSSRQMRNCSRTNKFESCSTLSNTQKHVKPKQIAYELHPAYSSFSRINSAVQTIQVGPR